MKTKKIIKNKIYLIFIIFTTILGASGQLLFKSALGNNNIIIYLIFIGLICYGLATLIYFFMLSKFHLSWLYSFNGLTYIFTLLLAHFVLFEKISLLRWVGIIIIAIGVIIVGLS